MTTLTRREFLQRVAILGLSVSAVAMLDGCGIFPAPTPTPARIPHIGFLSSGTPSTSIAIPPFQKGLADLGYIEGKNILIEYRYGDGINDRLPALAAELVALKLDILVANTAIATLSAKNATSTIPIVFTSNADPVGAGIVASLAHPGGNVTGLTTASTFLNGKRLEILKESIPGISRVAVSWNPTNPTDVVDWKETQDAAKPLGLQTQFVEVKKLDDAEGAVASAITGRAEALFSLDSQAVFFTRIAELATKSRLPSSFKFREAVVAGGLMSYGVNVPDLARRAATYVDKILKGTKPADLPVEGPTKFDFVINLKTAKQLGLTLPQSILAQATEVIQ